MYQENVRYGTRKKVRRRPADFRSRADIQQLKRYIQNTDILVTNNLNSRLYCSGGSTTQILMISMINTAIAAIIAFDQKERLIDLYDYQFPTTVATGLTKMPNETWIKQRRTELRSIADLGYHCRKTAAMFVASLCF